MQDGNLLLVRKKVELPPRCVKCNAPAHTMWRKKLYWHPPGFYLLIVMPGILIYAIVALIVRQRAEVLAGLCREHRSRRLRGIAAAWLIAILGIFLIVAGIVMQGDRRRETQGILVLLLGVACLLIGAVVGIVVARVLVPKKMDGEFAWLKGAGLEFLATFPRVN